MRYKLSLSKYVKLRGKFAAFKVSLPFHTLICLRQPTPIQYPDALVEMDLLLSVWFRF
jgi:hypothetical protein